MQKLAKSIEIYIENNSLKDEAIINTLLSHGYDLAISERVFVFAPIAFGRQIINSLAEVEFSDNFVLEVNNEKWENLKLSDDSVFNELMELSKIIFDKRSLSREQYYALANRSWELSAIIKILTDLEEKAGNADIELLNGTRLSDMHVWGYETLAPEKKGTIRKFIDKFKKR